MKIGRHAARGSIIAGEGLSFAVVGAICFVIDASVTVTLIHEGLGLYASRAVAFACAVSASWYLNRSFTFRRRRSRPILQEYCGFIGANLPGAAVNYGVYSVLVALGLLPPAAAVAAGSIAGMTCNFTLSRTLIFRLPTPRSEN